MSAARSPEKRAIGSPAAPIERSKELMKLFDLVFFLPLVTLAPSCASLKGDAGEKGAVKTEAAEAKGSKEEDGDDDKESAADKQKKAEHALEDARAELKIARQECQAAERKQKDEIEEAEYALAKEKEALDVFQKIGKPLELDKLKLGFDRSVQGVEESKAELRGLEHDKTEGAVTRDVELPRKEKDLELAVKKAENGLREARAAQAKLADENELKLKKAERGVDDAEKALAKAKAKAAKEKEKETKAAKT